MRVFFSEHNKDYTSYTFDYAVYAEMEQSSDLPKIYQGGFLPYSNDLEDAREIFYLARSLRVDLDGFEDSSENRRVNRKLEPLNLQLSLTAKNNFDLDQPDFRNLCLDYARERFTGNAMTPIRFDYILQRRVLSHIFKFTDPNGRSIGYVFTLIADNILHYWFAFFDHRIMENLPIGKWLMWRTIRWARDEGLEQVYLGTCYGEKSLYKVRDFKSLAFFDGAGWNRDITVLKNWCKSDDSPLKVDRFKLAK
jgi:GNAT superfamily N-acetyltransferase